MSIENLNQSAPLRGSDCYWPVLFAVLLHKLRLEEVHITSNDLGRMEAGFEPGSEPRIEARAVKGYIRVRICTGSE